MVNTAAFLLVSQVGAPAVQELHLTSTVPGPSRSRFEIYVNGTRVEDVKSTRKLDLTPHLRTGRNQIDVKYNAWNGKQSLFHPSTLEIRERPGGRPLLSIRANLDNPRGHSRLWVEKSP